MSIYFRLVIGPIVVCDVDLFAAREEPSKDAPPPQLNGGAGTILYPDEPQEAAVFGFTGRTHRPWLAPRSGGYSAVPDGKPKPPPPIGPGSASRWATPEPGVAAPEAGPDLPSGPATEPSEPSP